MHRPGPHSHKLLTAIHKLGLPWGFQAVRMGLGQPVVTAGGANYNASAFIVISPLFVIILAERGFRTEKTLGDPGLRFWQQLRRLNLGQGFTLLGA